MMTEAEKSVILAFAAGDVSKRNEAIVIHRRHIAKIGKHGDKFQRFMSEVDTSAPDLSLRAKARRDLLGGDYAK